MWHGLVGTPKQYAGTAGTVTLGAGEVLLFISAYSTAGGTVVIFGGPSITIPPSSGSNPVGIWTWWLEHTLMQANAQNGGTIVFTGTSHYFVHSVKEGNTPT